MRTNKEIVNEIERQVDAECVAELESLNKQLILAGSSVSPIIKPSLTSGGLKERKLIEESFLKNFIFTNDSSDTSTSDITLLVVLLSFFLSVVSAIFVAYMIIGMFC